MKDCVFSKKLEDENKWYIREIFERSNSVKEDGNEGQYHVIQNITTAVAKQIKEGRFDVWATIDPEAQQGYY